MAKWSIPGTFRLLDPSFVVAMRRSTYRVLELSQDLRADSLKSVRAQKTTCMRWKCPAYLPTLIFIGASNTHGAVLGEHFGD